ncbi:hypothetical protein [Actinomadura rubrisoli]|uniref:Uncharacterized protein n=1 Tax=Actinomadura rubrisoli TaxID=2530368 RepID=A0A4R5B5F5_9ACTN|nr:hypothetical protein [Actinomadura rubrisoli]TDD81458.1 hypothetical protein E1298_24135 [Actinomadura rubrisoli]
MRYGRPRPTREEIAAEKAVRECEARGHDFPDEPPRVAESSPGTHHVQRTPCRECGTVQVMFWTAPEPSAIQFVAIGTFEAPEPGDVPRLAERAAALTDAEYAAALADAGFDPDPPGLAPDRRATARAETLDLAVAVRSGQFYLLDRDQELRAIIPVPAGAEGAGLADTVPGAAVFWTAERGGTIPLTVVIAPGDPGAVLDGRSDVVEIAYRTATGHVRVQELGGAEHALPPLPGGHGGYRFRYHVHDADEGQARYLLQIWPEAHRRPASLKATSAWGTARQATAFTL